MRKSFMLMLALVLCLSMSAFAAEYEAVIDFSYGELGWGPMGGAVFYVTNEDARSESLSLAVVGRTQTWEGTIFELFNVLEDGGVYNFSIWVKALEAAPGSQVWITCVQVDTAGDAHYSRLCDPVEISTTEWVELVVENYEFTKEGYTGTAIYLEVDDEFASYLMDDFKITGNKPIHL